MLFSIRDNRGDGNSNKLIAHRDKEIHAIYIPHKGKSCMLLILHTSFLVFQSLFLCIQENELSICSSLSFLILIVCYLHYGHKLIPT